MSLAITNHITDWRLDLGNKQTKIVVAVVVRFGLAVQVGNYYRKAIRQKQQAGAEARQAKKQKINGPKGVSLPLAWQQMWQQANLNLSDTR